MENRKFIKYLILIAGVILTPAFNIQAYNDETTHPALTQEVIEYFQYSFSQYELSDEDKEAIEKGSIEEDFFIRPLNHFYDPIYKKGLKGYVSAKEWAQNTLFQTFLDLEYTAKLGNTSQKYFNANSDFSWDRAVFEYAHGDKQRALETLGHILHLLEDMAVPAHTRDDAHPIKSPYEEFTKQFLKENITTSEDLIKEDKGVIVYDNLDQYFENLALFTNKSFFSLDTVLVDKYSEPRVVYEKINILSDNLEHSFGFSNEGIKLIELGYEEEFDFTGNKNSKDTYLLNDIDNLVFQNYWQILSKQAVLHGAGVIKLFFDEVEKERETLALYKKNQSVGEKVLAGVVKLKDKTKEVGSKIISSISRAVSRIDRRDLLAKSEDLWVVADIARGMGEVSKGIEEFIELDEESRAKQNAQKESSKLDKMISETEKTLALLQQQFDRNPFPSQIHNENDGIGGTKEDLEDVMPDETTPEADEGDKLSIEGYVPGFGGGGSSADTTTAVSSGGGNSSPNTSSPTAGGIPVATTTIPLINPDTVLEISQCDNSFSLDSCLIATTTLDIVWSSTASTTEISHFNIINNGVFSTTTDTSIQINNLLDGDEYSISVATIGIDNSTLATSTQMAKISFMPVVINEIAWAGTDASPEDEWIELYNLSDEDIDLSNWILYAEDLVPFIELNGTISAGGYYLIERTDDTTVSDISADLITPFSGLGTGSGLSNSGENLILVYSENGQATTTIDTVSFESDWPNKNDICSYGKCRTLEKYNPYVLEGGDNNWNLSESYSASAHLFNGIDSNGDLIKGTPKKRNSLNYRITINNELNEDKTITKARSPYFVGREGFHIKEGNTLIVEEGVVIKFKSNMLIDGTIKTNGSNSEPVVLTSFFDDEYGGDMNNDGICDFDNIVPETTCPYPKSWSGVEITLKSGDSSFDNTIFRYGGNSNVHLPKTMISVDSSNVIFSNSIFEKSRYSGLAFLNSTSTITNCIFRDNRQRTSQENNDFYGLYAIRGKIVIENSEFDNNQFGVGMFDTVGSEVRGSVFYNHPEVPLVMSGSTGFSLENNSGSENKVDAVQVRGSVTREGQNTVLAKNDLPYWVKNNIYVAEGSLLTINPGTVFKFDNSSVNTGSFVINGELNMVGESGSEIIMTSVEDDSDGTDIYGDGAKDVDDIKKMGRLIFNSATSTIENANFRFMDRSLSYTKGSPISLRNIDIGNSLWSIYSDDPDTPVSLVENVTFSTTMSKSVLNNWP